MTALLCCTLWLVGNFLFMAAEVRAAVEYTGKSFSDPFSEDTKARPAADDSTKRIASKVDLSGLTVQGIVVSPDGNLAIVKGKVVRTGDTIQGFRIHAIETDGVIFSGGAAGQQKFYKITHKGQAPS